MLGIIQSRSFPCWSAPGYDPNHVASSPLVRMSAIATQGGGFINVRTGIGSTPSAGAPSSSIDAIQGRCWIPTTTADSTLLSKNTGAINLTNGSNNYTLAAICSLSSTGSNFPIIFTAGNVTGKVSFQGFQGRFAINVSGGAVVTATPLSFISLRPYFVVASVNPNNVAFVYRDLLTGEIFSQVSAGSSSNASTTDGQYIIGAGAGQAPVLGSQIAAIMASAACTPLAQLLSWAEDPWSFWYPPSFDAYVGVTSVVTTAIQSNLLLMGVG